MLLYYLFDFIIREVNSINITLGYSPLEAISKNLIRKKLYLIVLIDFKYKILAKLDSMTYKVKSVKLNSIIY